ncbi:cysteine desulfurase-like protein [Aggregicoccus sp. 17bor-14]|uniref:cysteine desulfurase-like protein n=1 Tax=Myxococcaceae TaxID=31 RepID=UPI00129CFDDF|nr:MULTISPECIES: cysteine desulfurase-like protein [Myxococcaceae]MBF5041963.1 cysteine desulfurase-like protein [Simulacricoccus sp. 17bor-14]MRI87744.1 cysteine desulfurase-like protein [Aggregicoccus sp. 17bor-14]
MRSSPPSPASVRSHFPALRSGFRYLDNAAGAQVPTHCIQAIADFLTAGSCNVGMPYPASRRATEVKARARAETAAFLGCTPEEVMLGTSATALSFQLARAFSRLFRAGDEVVVSELEHEANASPWRALEAQGVQVRTWRARWPEGRLDPADLRPLLSERTRLVAVTAAANSVGTTPDVAAAGALAREAGAWLIVDAVHSSPHHLPHVKAWGADFALFSPYKVFGPHLGCLYVREGLLAGLPADKLWFVPDDSPQKFEPGTASHEALAGWLGSLRYLREVLGDGLPGREGLQRAYGHIESLERPLLEAGLERLQALPHVTLYGLRTPEGRAATFCFNVQGLTPRQVAERLAQEEIGVAAGHYYATLAMQALGRMPDGAVRASLLHYNTLDEVDALARALERMRAA